MWSVRIVVPLKCTTRSPVSRAGKEIIVLLNRHMENKERSVVPCVPWPFDRPYATSLSHVEKCGSCACGVCCCPVKPWSRYDGVNQSSYRGSAAQEIPEASRWLRMENWERFIISRSHWIHQWFNLHRAKHWNILIPVTSDNEFISVALPVWNMYLVTVW